MYKRIVFEWSSVDIEDEVINKGIDVSEEKIEKICDIVEDELNNNDMLSDMIWDIIDDAIKEVSEE